MVWWLQVPYKIKDAELDYDNYKQVPESPIGRDEEPHLCMVLKKYRKVVLAVSFYKKMTVLSRHVWFFWVCLTGMSVVS